MDTETEEETEETALARYAETLDEAVDLLEYLYKSADAAIPDSVRGDVYRAWSTLREARHGMPL